MLVLDLPKFKCNCQFGRQASRLMFVIISARRNLNDSLSYEKSRFVVLPFRL
jgi:hypothetical protein